jgi:hypothetical protein
MMANKEEYIFIKICNLINNKQINIELDEKIAEGIYSNLAIITLHQSLF